MLKALTVLIMFIFISGCASHYPNQNVIGKQFPTISGESLDKKQFIIPQDFENKHTLLLIGYKHDSQFDIDRWFIALDMSAVNITAYELPTIQGMLPRMFSTFIDSGMRKGIPKELWGGVITIYKQGDAVQAFTGNINPKNSRVVLIDKNGKIVYFYDRGFSVAAFNELKSVIEKQQ